MIQTKINLFYVCWQRYMLQEIIYLQPAIECVNDVTFSQNYVTLFFSEVVTFIQNFYQLKHFARNEV